MFKMVDPLINGRDKWLRLGRLLPALCIQPLPAATELGVDRADVFAVVLIGRPDQRQLRIKDLVSRDAVYPNDGMRAGPIVITLADQLGAGMNPDHAAFCCKCPQDVV